MLVAYADPDVHTAFETSFVNDFTQGEIVIDDDTVAGAFANALPISTVSRGGWRIRYSIPMAFRRSSTVHVSVSCRRSRFRGMACAVTQPALRH